MNSVSVNLHDLVTNNYVFLPNLTWPNMDEFEIS